MLILLAYIHQKLIVLNESIDAEPYTRRYLKEKLENKYDELIYFTSTERRSDILCFKNKMSTILRDYHQKIKQSEDDHVQNILQAAVKLLINDIKTMDINSEKYPTISEIAQDYAVPESLKYFLGELLRSQDLV